MLMATFRGQDIRFVELRAGLLSPPTDIRPPNFNLAGICNSNYTPGSHAGYWDSNRQLFVVIAWGTDFTSTSGTLVIEWTPNGPATSVSIIPIFATTNLSCAFFDAPSQAGIVVLSDGQVVELGSGYSITRVSPAAVPFQVQINPGTLRSAAYDTARRRLVCLVGYPIPTIWEYDFVGQTWLQGPACPTGFTLRANAVLSYDPTRNITVVFGGFPATSSGGYVAPASPLNDTWHYDGYQVSATDLTLAPPGRHSTSSLYDSSTQRITIIGGGQASTNACHGNLRDIWSYVPALSTADFRAFGQGCPGSFGTPGLAVAPGAAPRAGQSFAVLVNRVPITSSVFLMLGTSSTLWNGQALPFSLTTFGAPGCSMLTGPDFVFTTTNVLGTAIWSLALPRSLAGVTLYCQGVVFDPPVNTMGLTVSNAGQIIIGF